LGLRVCSYRGVGYTGMRAQSVGHTGFAGMHGALGFQGVSVSEGFLPPRLRLRVHAAWEGGRHRRAPIAPRRTRRHRSAPGREHGRNGRPHQAPCAQGRQRHRKRTRRALWGSGEAGFYRFYTLTWSPLPKKTVVSRRRGPVASAPDCPIGYALWIVHPPRANHFHGKMRLNSEPSSRPLPVSVVVNLGRPPS
jgi:hypothetical protein